MYPMECPNFWLIRAINPDHRGATALVPPKVWPCPSTRTLYPVAGSASPETSGTPRPTRLPGFEEVGTLKPFCQSGRGNTSLIPPPVAPPADPLFHTTSLIITPLLDTNCVPPQPRAK